MSCSTSRRRRCSRVPWFSIVRLLVLLAGGVAALLLTAGCASESDLPWNSRQPWEGSPQIPGMPTTP
jgi:hypothetical protein